VRSWIDQLVVQGFLEIRDKEGLPLLAMTEAGRELCRSDGPVRLGRFAGRPAAARSRAAAKPGRGAQAEELDAEGAALFERLRALRRLIAQRQGVPPYVVFSDATLRDLAQLHPRDESELLAVKGVGDHKLGRYGAAFLALLAGEEPEGAAGRLPEPGGRERPT
jgi:ATP-dependent DNA helicase RecQ